MKKPAQTDITLAALETLVSRHGGHISPAILRDEARDPMSPFHQFFQWDDTEAAEQYRLIQASGMIRRWKGNIMRIDSEAKIVHIQATRRVQSPAGQRGPGAQSYETIESIMADPAKAADLEQTVLNELMAYRRRYSAIKVLADIWRAVDDAAELLFEQRAPKHKDGDRPTA